MLVDITVIRKVESRGNSQTLMIDGTKLTQREFIDVLVGATI